MEESPCSKKPKLGTVDSIIMSSIYVLMLSDIFFIKLNEDGPFKSVADIQDTFDVWCKKIESFHTQLNLKVNICLKPVL